MKAKWCMLEGIIWPTCVCLSSKWTATQMRKKQATNIDRSIKTSAVEVIKQMKCLPETGCIQEGGEN